MLNKVHYQSFFFSEHRYSEMIQYSFLLDFYSTGGGETSQSLKLIAIIFMLINTAGVTFFLGAFYGTVLLEAFIFEVRFEFSESYVYLSRD